MEINKYIKYKNKYIKLKNLIGGNILPNDVFNYIESIGFEFEFSSITPLINTKNGEEYNYKIFDFRNDKVKIIDTPNIEFIMFADTLSKKRIDTVDYEKLFKKENESNIININIENQPLRYTCKYDKIQNLEFIITFKQIKLSNNIIKEKYKEAKEMLQQYLKDETKSNKIVNINIDNSQKKFNSSIIKYNIDSNDIILLSTLWLYNMNTYEISYRFTPQCTIKIKYEHVIKVLYYIYPQLFSGHHILQFAVNLISLCNKILNSNNLPLMECEYVYLENWFVLVILYLIFYIRYKINNKTGTKLFKSFCVFFIRHSLYKLCPLTIEQKTILINNNEFIELLESIQDILINKIKDIQTLEFIPTLYDYIDILFNNKDYNNTKNLKFGSDDVPISNESTMFDTENMKDYNQFIYIEYRFFVNEVGIQEKYERKFDEL
jgi:hypothetical protein